jgi:hypothetical protein
MKVERRIWIDSKNRMLFIGHLGKMSISILKNLTKVKAYM